MRDEALLEATLDRLLREEKAQPPLEAPNVPIRRTPLEARAFDQGRIAMLAWVLNLDA